MSKITGMVVKRSLESVRAGGSDITCVPGLSIEVKRKKMILPNDMSQFWLQCLRQSEKENAKPVLFAKEDRRDWSVTVALGDMCPVKDMKSLPVQMDVQAFKTIYKRWHDE